MSFITDWFAVQFAGIWQLIWTFGIGGVLIVLFLLGWYFSPIRKAAFLWGAAIVAAVMISISIGVHLGENRVQAQWDAARAVSLQKARKARVDGVRDAHRKPSRWLPNKRDPDLRD